jgi:hypothetical protein
MTQYRAARSILGESQTWQQALYGLEEAKNPAAVQHSLGFKLGQKHAAAGKELKFKSHHNKYFRAGYQSGSRNPKRATILGYYAESFSDDNSALSEGGTSAGVKKGWEKRKGKEMTDAQVHLAAKHFTQSNLGGWGPSAGGKKPKNANDIERSYGAAFHAHAADGVDISDEFNSWVKDIRKGDPYVHKTIMKEIPFVHKHGGSPDPAATKKLAPYYLRRE